MFSNNEIIHLKMVLLGASYVGKTYLMLQFTDGTFETIRTSATVGSSHRNRTLLIDGRPVRLTVWDTAGSERFHALTPMYYRNARAALVVYDIRCRDSFERAKSWIVELREQVTEPMVIALVGNKLDLFVQRTVKYGEAKEYAQREGLLFMETSAKTAQNVEKIFLATVKQAVQEDWVHLEAAPVAEGQDDIIRLGRAKKGKLRQKLRCR